MCYQHITNFAAWAKSRPVQTIALTFLSNLTNSTEAKGSDAIVSAAHMAGICLALNSISNSCTFSQDTWIVDSGASEHMCFRPVNLQDLNVLCQPIMVNLPNGTRVKVTHQGRLRISPELVLDHVLYVPHFKFNLLSVKRLCQQLKCMVQFTEDKCTV